MPAKNSIKIYIEDGYYRLYNRGVEKHPIFLDVQDYDVFISYLKEYLLPKDEKELLKSLNDPATSSKARTRIARIFQLRNYNSEIKLLAFCLRPNHFHFFVKQVTRDAIDRFMSSLCTRYTTYFNRKYKRVGALYQGVYKAVLMENEPQYLHITRYIHKQALAKSKISDDVDRLSSYPEYLGLRKSQWVHPEEILSFFSAANTALSYENFVAEYDPFDEIEGEDSII